jgi:O-antigen ligase
MTVVRSDGDAVAVVGEPLATAAETPDRFDAVSFVVAAAVAIVAVVCGLAVALLVADTDLDQQLLLFAGAAPVGAALTYVAVTRFEWFVWILLAVRPSVDYFGAAELGPGAMISSLFLLVAVPWLVVQRRAGEWVPASGTVIALCCFGGAVALSVVTSTLRLTSAAAALEIFAGITMFLVLEQLLTGRPDRVRLMIRVLLVSVAFPLLLGLVQMMSAGGDRVSGPFVHPSPYGTFLVAMMLLVISLATVARGRRRVLLLVLVALLAVVLVGTAHRAGWISLVVGVLYLAYRRSRWILPVVVVGLVLAFTTVPAVSERFSDLGEQEVWLPEGVPRNSWEWRVQYWERIIPSASDSPITGIGPGVVVETQPDEREPHNVGVQAYVEMGVLGLGALVAACVLFGRALSRRRSAAAAPFDVALATASIAIALAFLMQAVSENLLQQTYAWWLLAATTAWGYRTAVPPRGAEIAPRDRSADEHPTLVASPDHG